MSARVYGPSLTPQERHDTGACEPRSASRANRLVRVDEAIWAEFEPAIGDRSVAETLGHYIELGVARARGARAGEDDVAQRELVDALERARHTAEAPAHLAIDRFDAESASRTAGHPTATPTSVDRG